MRVWLCMHPLSISSLWSPNIHTGDYAACKTRAIDKDMPNITSSKSSQRVTSSIDSDDYSRQLDADPTHPNDLSGQGPHQDFSASQVPLPIEHIACMDCPCPGSSSSSSKFADASSMSKVTVLMWKVCLAHCQKLDNSQMLLTLPRSILSVEEIFV